jgi:hypothetical protein
MTFFGALKGGVMVWDGGTIWRIALGVFFVLCGCGVGYALFRVGSAFKRLAHILSSVDSRVLPLLTRVETTLDGFNSELTKVEQITGSVAEMVKAAEETTTALHNAVSTPIRKIAGVAGGVRESIKSFMAARRKGY